MNRRPIGLAVAAAGLVIAVVGLIGSVADDDSSDVVDDESIIVSAQTTAGASQSTSANTSPTTVAPTTVTPTTTTTPVETSAPPSTATPRQVETPAEFLAVFTEALRSGDEGFLLRRIHPEVELRYGRPACEAYLAGISDQQFAGELEGSAPAPDWVWETDGKSTPIADAIVAQVIRRAGEPASEVHFAVVDDELRWFTDCGDEIS